MTVRAGALLFAVVSVLAGAWLDVESLTNRPDSLDQTCASNSRAVVADLSGRLHAVWRGHAGRMLGVWYMCSPGDSVRWRDTTVLSTDTAPATAPCLALDSAGNLHVAWTSGERLRLATREYPSGVWTVHSPLPVFRGDSSVSLACDAAGRQHLVWLRGGGYDARICYVNHDSTGWHDFDTIGAAHANTGLGCPSIAAAGNGDLMVVWKDQLAEPTILARLRLAGLWQDAEVISESVGCLAPCAARSADSLWHVVWISHPRVLWRFRSGTGWSRDTCIGLSRSSEPASAMAADPEGGLHFVWLGEPYPGADQQVFYRRRSGAGEWTDPDTLARGRATYRRYVSVAAGQGGCQVIWSEWANAQRLPAVRLRRYVVMHDVGITGLLVPYDTVDSGTVLAGVTAVVRNNGDLAESTVVVLLKIGQFRSTRVVPYLQAAGTDSVEFDSWLAGIRGWNTLVCSTRVAGDWDPGNDTLRDSVFVRVRDVAVDSTLSPDTLVAADTVFPEVAVRNCGNVSTVMDCHVWITGAGVSYHRRQRYSIAPDSLGLLMFPPCEVGVGQFVMRCSLACVGDMRPTNDTASRLFRVIRRDVGAAGIVRPTGRLDSGSTIVPCANVANYGSETESFRVVIRIGQVYADTALVHSLAPGRVWPVEFGEWRASEARMVAVTCSTALAGDQREGNDALQETVFVYVADASVEEIVYPREQIGLGDVRPRIRIANRGNESETVSVRVVIDSDSGSLFSDSLSVAISCSRDTVVELSPWHVYRGGDYRCTGWVSLAGDMRPENDTGVSQFHVVRFDALILGIRQPAETVAAGSVLPTVTVGNESEEACDVGVYMRITQEDTLVYFDSVICAAMPAGDTSSVQLRIWRAVPGSYSVQAWVVAVQDSIHENDSSSLIVVVDSLRSCRWRELTPMPAGPRSAATGAGGSMAVLGGSLFALKGGGSCEFYLYLCGEDSWRTLAPVPRGTSGRGVKGGGALTSDGDNCLFALKGSRTHEFWRYEVGADSWVAATSLPPGLPPARFGSGLAYLHQRDTAKIFCVKGGGTLDFLVYWVPQNQWHARRSMPLGPRGKKARRGTAIVAVGQRVFVLKGGTNEFYEYRPRTDDWVVRAEVPARGRSGHFRRCRDGAALASDGVRFVYALRGGCCNELWQYDVLRDNWGQLEDVPPGNEIEWVRAGAALAYLAGRVYCLKGRGTRAFWCYDCTASFLPATLGRGGIALDEQGSKVSMSSYFSPRIVRAGATLLFGSGAAVRDATGRVVPTGAGRTSLALPGVYFIQPEKGEKPAYKLVVVR